MILQNENDPVSPFAIKSLQRSTIMSLATFYLVNSLNVRSTFNDNYQSCALFSIQFRRTVGQSLINQIVNNSDSSMNRRTMSRSQVIQSRSLHSHSLIPLTPSPTISSTAPLFIFEKASAALATSFISWVINKPSI